MSSGDTSSFRFLTMDRSISARDWVELSTGRSTESSLKLLVSFKTSAVAETSAALRAAAEVAGWAELVNSGGISKTAKMPAPTTSGQSRLRKRGGRARWWRLI